MDKDIKALFESLNGKLAKLNGKIVKLQAEMDKLNTAKTVTCNTYDSFHLPPGVKNARSFGYRCANVPGSYRVGRSWCCPREAWDLAHGAF